MTVLGIHTVHELRNLWDGYSYELQRMNGALANAWDAWTAADPQGFAALNADYARVSQAVAALGGTVDQVIASAQLPGADEDETPAVDPMNPGTDLFNALLAAFATGDASGPTTPGPGGFDDIDRRFRTGPVANLAPTYPAMPQPDAPDFDLQAYQFADAALKVVQKGVSFGTSTLVLVAVGLVAGLLIARR